MEGRGRKERLGCRKEMGKVVEVMGGRVEKERKVMKREVEKE